MSDDFLLARLKKLQSALSLRELDAILITDKINMGYATGFTGSGGYALVTANEAILITDSRYTLRARQECPHFSVVIASGSGGYSESLGEMLADRSHVKSVGVEANSVTLALFGQFQADLPSTIILTPTNNIIEDLRMIKDADEIARIRRAIVVAEESFESIKEKIRPGIAERDVAIELDFAMRRRGASAPAFETIVASGPQGARPHHQPNERLLAAGDLVTIDWGASVNGYNSDLTRTVAVGGVEFTDKQRQVHAIVLEAQQRAIRAIRPGKTGREIDGVARGYITEQGYGEAFGHGLGHALGRQVHDGPGFSMRAADHVLRPGMVITVEPGIYLEDWGGVRIEEDIVVTENGCEVLTHLFNGWEVLG